MRLSASAALAVMVLVLGGCNQGELEELRTKVDELERSVQDKNFQIIQLEDQLDSARAAAEEVRSAFNDLSFEIDNFTDGYTNWRHIVPSVIIEAMDVDSKLRALEACL